MPLRGIAGHRAGCGAGSLHGALRRPIGVASILLAGLISLVVGGCVGLKPRLDGTSGPITWQATDLRIINREIAGTNRDLYTFTLVLTETRGRAVTFTQADYTISQPDVSEVAVSKQRTILWKLHPRGQLRKPFSFYWQCDDFDCTSMNVNPAPWWHITLTGTDDRGHPVRVVIDLRLPPNPPAPQILQAAAPLPRPPLAVAAAVTVSPEAIPIQIVNNTILVNAVVNDRDQVTLLLDTGATHTILTPETVKRLQIRRTPQAAKQTAVVAGGQVVEFSFAELATLAVGNAVAENFSVGIAKAFPDMPLVDGILGWDFLRHYKVTLRYATSQLWLESPAATPGSQPITTPVSMGQRSSVPLLIRGNRLWVRATVNQWEDLTFLLDTGAQYTLVHPSTAARIGLTPTADAPQFTISVFGGGQRTVPFAQLSSLAVGDATVRDMHVGVLKVIPRAPAVGGVLGGDFLQHFTVIIDHANRVLHLESDAVVQR